MRSLADLPALAAEVQAGAAEWAARKDVATLCAAFNTTGKLGMAPAQRPLLHRTLATLAAAYLPLVPGLGDAKHCTLPLWACAKAGYWGGGLAAALLQRLGRDGGALLQRGTGQNHSNMWLALSEAPPGVFEALGPTDAVLSCSVDCLLRMRAGEVVPQQCSNVLLACARLRYGGRSDLLHHLTACLAAQPTAANHQALANSLYALGELCKDCGHSPQPQDLQRLAAAVVGLLRAPPQSGANPGGFIPQELSNMLLGCSKLGYSNPALLLPLAAAAGQAAKRSNEQDLANSLYALAVLGCKDPSYAPAVEHLAVECKRRGFADFNPQGLSNSAWALEKLGYCSDQAWFAAAVAAAVRPDIMRAFTAQGLSNVWLALAGVRHRPVAALLEGTIAASEVLQSRANGQDCANLLWALATLGVPYDRRLMDVLVKRLCELLPKRGEVTEQGLANSLWALAVMGPDALFRYRRCIGQLLLEAVRRWDAAEAASVDIEKGLAQLWQVQQELAHADGCGELAGILAAAGGPAGSQQGSLLSAMQSAADAKWRMVDGATSDLQQQVASALGRLQRQQQATGVPFITSICEEQAVEGLVGRVDVVVELASGRRVAVEVDGPTHFVATSPNTYARGGATRLRDRQLGRVFGAGNVVSVPYYEWNEVRGDKGHEERYLMRLLGGR